MTAYSRSPEEIYCIVSLGLAAIALCGAVAVSLIWSALVMLARSADVKGAMVNDSKPDYRAFGEATLRQDDPTLVTKRLRWQ